MKHDEQSRQTKQALSSAMKRLMGSKPLNRITIQELVEECGVNRKTFYYHFEDIFALVKWTLEQEAICLFDRYDLIGEHSEAINFALDYIEGNLPMLRNIVRSIGGAEIRRFFFTDIYAPMYRLVCGSAQNRGLSVPESYRVFLSRFLTEAISGILMDCVEGDALSDRERLSGYITATLVDTIPNALENAAKLYAGAEDNR